MSTELGTREGLIGELRSGITDIMRYRQDGIRPTSVLGCLLIRGSVTTPEAIAGNTGIRLYEVEETITMLAEQKLVVDFVKDGVRNVLPFAEYPVD